jgi:hypothetical protein
MQFMIVTTGSSAGTVVLSHTTRYPRTNSLIVGVAVCVTPSSS